MAAIGGQWTEKDFIQVGNLSKTRAGQPRFTVAYRPDAYMRACSNHGSRGPRRSRRFRSRSPRGRRSRSPRVRDDSRGSERHDARGPRHRGRRGGGKGGSRGPRRGRRNDPEEHLSKILAYALRHLSHDGLFKDEQGWINMENLLKVLGEINRHEDFDQADILEVIRSRKNKDGEPRYEEQQKGHGIYVRARNKHTA
eukprot:708049-Amphidinium_carterae.1